MNRIHKALKGLVRRATPRQLRIAGYLYVAIIAAALWIHSPGLEVGSAWTLGGLGIALALWAEADAIEANDRICDQLEELTVSVGRLGAVPARHQEDLQLAEECGGEQPQAPDDRGDAGSCFEAGGDRRHDDVDEHAEGSSEHE